MGYIQCAYLPLKIARFELVAGLIKSRTPPALRGGAEVHVKKSMLDTRRNSFRIRELADD